MRLKVVFDVAGVGAVRASDRFGDRCTLYWQFVLR